MSGVVIAVDGKTLRGTCGSDGTGGVHLLAAMTHQTGAVVAQAQVEDKTSEIAWFAPLLDRIDDLAGVVVTADALHTVRDHARYLVGRGADYVFIVKENQHRLYELLDGLRWQHAPTHTTTNAGHGRRERRTIQVLPAPKNIGFPAAAQALSCQALYHPHRHRQDQRRRRTRHHQPHHRPGRPTTHRFPRTQPPGHREQTALGPRRHLR